MKHILRETSGEGTFEQWVNDISEAGLLCTEYKAKVGMSMSNKQLIDIAMDANGMTYLCKMAGKGHGLPYSVITSRFAPFINGRYVSRHRSKNGREYTSAIYCRYDGLIDDAKVTLLTILGSKCTIEVSPYHVIRVYVDSKSDVDIKCPETSEAYVEYWGAPKIGAHGAKNNITLIAND